MANVDNTGGIKSTTDLNKSLISLMECPVCKFYLVPPVSQCKNGHNVCAKCQPSLQTCPVCRENFTGGRNILADNLANVCSFPCPNSELGCVVKQSLTKILHHASKCQYRKYDCKFGNNCTWQGYSADIKDHFKMHHALHWKVGEYNVFDITDYQVWGTNSKINMILALDELFTCFLKYDGNKLYGAINYIGTEVKAKDFLYKFKLFSKDGKRKIVHRHIVHADFLDFDSIIKSGKCFGLDVNIARNFIDDDKLFITVRIKNAPI